MSRTGGWRRFFRRKRADAELRLELDFYLAEETEENVARGMARDEARRMAYRKLGHPQQVRERLWRQNTWTWLDGLERDVRYAARTLMRSPGFALLAVLIIALGIGANVALFTIVRGVLLKPLPFRDPDRLTMVYERGVVDDSGNDFNVVAGGMYAEWKKQNQTFADLAIAGGAEFNLAGGNGQLPEKVHGINCSWNLLPLLGVEPALGRSFTAGDDQRPADGTVLLTWGMWKRRFGGDPAIVTRTIRLNTLPYTVVGILPAWFVFPEDPAAQILTPIYHDKPADRMESLGNHWFQVIGRLRPGVTPEQAKADLSLIAHRLHEAHRDNALVGKAANIRPLLEDMVGDLRTPLYVLLGATGCVLLVACLNVANLLVARAAARRREHAIRVALGGARWRLLREQLMETLLISAAGGAAGLLLANLGIAWLAHSREELMRAESIAIDGAVAAFTVGLIVLCAVFAAAASSLGAKDDRLLGMLQEGSRSQSAGHGRLRLRTALLTVEVGLTVVLLVTAGLLLKSYQRLRSSDMGCITQNVLTMRIGLFGKGYNEPERKIAFFQELLSRVRALPGVEAAGFVQSAPGQGFWGDNGFVVVEHPPLPPGQTQLAMYRWADPGYFAALGIPVLRGRTFDPDKTLERADEVIISKSFVEQHFPGEEPLGKHLRIDNRTLTIVGVVGDVRYTPAEDVFPTQYVPLLTGFPNNGTLVIRSSKDVEQLPLPVQRVVQELDRDLPVSDVLTMDQLLGKTTAGSQFDSVLVAAFAGITLLLAAAGLYGVLAYLVTQRTAEIGIRIALGAQRTQVLRLTLFDGLRPALLGLVAGLVASAGAVRLIRSMLYRTEALDASVYLTVTVTLLLVAAAASALPAWRASRLDPAQALRAE